MINIRDTLQEQDRKEAEEYYHVVKRLMREERMSYWIGNPSVEIIFGELFLEEFQQPEEVETVQKYIEQLKQINTIDSTCLVMVGLPTCIRPLQIWQSFGQTIEFVKQCRVIKVEEPGFYSLLIMLSKNHCKQFYKSNFGRKINQLQSYLILFRQIDTITIQFDQFVISEKTELQIFRRKRTNEIHPVDPENIFMSYTIDQSAASSTFVCAICFEEMIGSSSGILSILCGHYFHEDCLLKWTQNTCPLCRYHQQPPTISYCEACNNSQNLWLCLVCGKKLCSGDHQNLLSQNSHIYQHYKQSQHSIAMQIQSKFIYEFLLKDFLHRVYFNQKTQSPDAGVPKYKKSKDLVREYQKVARLQMQQQRKYFEKQISDNKKKQKEAIISLQNQIKAMKDQNAKLITQYDEEQRKQITQLQSEYKTAEKYHSLLVVKLKSLQNKSNKISQKSNKQLQQIQYQILEKRQQIKDIQQNIAANQKIKKKLEGQKISKEYFVKK